MMLSQTGVEIGEEDDDMSVRHLGLTDVVDCIAAQTVDAGDECLLRPIDVLKGDTEFNIFESHYH